MKIAPHDFRLPGGKKIRLDQWATDISPLYKSEKHYKQLLAAGVAELSGLQRLLYASDRYSVLLIFQAMDTAGKDGAIRHVMSGVNPQGCQVFSFKHPSATELDHDFLWRTTQCLPERGRIGIFNRSYYEEVLIVRVHPEILRAQRLPDDLLDEKTVWQERYRSIVDLEHHLHRNGTRVIKFSCTFPGTNNASAFWSASMNRTRTGKSTGPTSTSENSGNSTCKPMRHACAQRARKLRRGTWFPPTTNTMRGSLFRGSSPTRC